MTFPNATIADAFAKPITHKVVTTYNDGSTRTHETRSFAQADVWAIGERRKIGRNFLSRTTGEWVSVASVEIVKIEG